MDRLEPFFSSARLDDPADIFKDRQVFLLSGKKMDAIQEALWCTQKQLTS
jgi:hypothetical protein